MAQDVVLPALGESINEGTVTEWYVSVGDTVEADQPLFELSSDKIDTEVPSPVAGTIVEILVDVDGVAEVGEVVARIGEASEVAGSSSSDNEPQEPAKAEAPAEQPQEEAKAQEAAPAQDNNSSGNASGSGELTDIVLPELGESINEGTITEWYVSVGDTVEVDQPLFELSSDKIDTEVPSPVAGTIAEILTEADETIEVGTIVARVGSGSASSSAPSSSDSSSQGSAESAPKQEAPQQSSAPSQSSSSSNNASGPAGGDAYASPLVRSLAKEKGIDLSTVSGSGEGGRITREDIESHSGGSSAPAQSRPAQSQPAQSQSAPAAKAEQSKPAQESKKSAPSTPVPTATGRERVEKLNRIRGKIAEKMIESQELAAQLTTFQEADCTNLMAARAKVKNQFKSREGISLSPFAMVARACVIAAKDHPLVNAFADWDTMDLHIREYINLGIAVDTDKGLLVPNVKNAQNLNIAGLAHSIADLAAKARGEDGKKIDFADIQNGTMTLTNTGSRGVLFDTPILNYPEVAIIGIGAIAKRPAVVKGANGEDLIGVRDMMYLSMTYDHRLLDGADAARYITDVKKIIETLDWERELA